MSHAFVPVQWNRNKRVYDICLWAGIALVFALEWIVASAAVPAAQRVSPEIQFLRTMGDTGFLLLNLILATGPLARLDTRFLPLLYNRRHMGVSFFLIALTHGVFALVWYHGFGVVDPLTSLFTSQGGRGDLSDWRFQPLGFFALVIFFLLAATSHDFWNWVLGPVLWKGLHMSIYLAYGLVMAHMAFGPAQSAHSALPAWAPLVSVITLGGLHLAAALKGRKVASDIGQTDGGWIPIHQPKDIAPGTARVVALAGSEAIAVFRNEAGAFGAISNICRHQAGPLGEGCMVDGLVTCPWHGFQYRLEDGASPPPFDEKVATYEMKEEGGRLLLNPQPLAPGTPRPLVELAASGEVAT